MGKKQKKKNIKQKSDVGMCDRFALNSTEDYRFWSPNNRWWSLKTTASVKASCTVSEWYGLKVSRQMADTEALIFPCTVM